jgi:hypothetical protein
VPVEGTRAEVDALSGTWAGEYWTADSGRHGTVRFRLRPGVDTAYGEVEMTFSRALRLYGDPAEQDLPRHPCTVIAIEVVRLERAKVRGTLAPYWDPDCDCRTFTVFEGELAGDRVSGSFTSGAGPHAPPRLTGRWFARRQRGR